MATTGGASALLVFPPAPFTLGQSPQMALAHFSRIAEASDLPIIVFQYPIASGQGYPPDTLLRMCEEIPNVRAIKDWCGNPQQHEWHVRTLQSLPRPVNVLSTHSAWLLSSLVLGCNGLLSGSGSVIPDLQSALFRAVRSNDLEEARRIDGRIYPLARVFYSEPRVDMHNRMKEALVLLGRQKRAVVRPPLTKIDDAEIAGIRQALVESGLLRRKPTPRRRAGFGGDATRIAPDRARERMKNFQSATSPLPASSSAMGRGGRRSRCSPPTTPTIGKRHLAELDPAVFDPASGKMVITYQTYMVRTPRHTVLIDVAAKAYHRDRWDRPICFADPFSTSDDGADRGRRRMR